MTNGVLFLGGSGGLKESFKLDEEYFSLLPNDSKILYIPIALDLDVVKSESCYDWFSSVVSAHCKEKYIDIMMILEKDEIPDLSDFNSVYIGGGNTFKLLNYLKKTGFGAKIVDFLKEGGIVYGGSAGAIVFGKDINTVEEENDINLVDSNGFNLANGMSVICHYDNTLNNKILKSLKKVNSDIIAIPEDSGVILNKGVISIVGKSFIFKKDGSFKELK